MNFAPAIIVRAVLAVVLVGLGLWALHWVYEAGVRDGKSNLARLVYEAEQRARADHGDRVIITEGVDHATVTKLRDAQRRADALRAESDGLRKQLAALASTAPRDTPAAGCADVIRQRDRLAELLAEGADLLREGQAAGDRLAVTAEGLQSYVSGVCRLPVTP
jgi:hypothetical protein